MSDRIFNRLKRKIQTHQATISVIGLGYVGLPLAVEFAKVGFRVIGIDLNKEKVQTIRKGKTYILDIDPQAMKQAVTKDKRLTATTDYSRLTEADVIIICVPTPLGKVKDPDISHIIKATRSIQPHLKRGQLISLESTTYPGTTEEVLVPILEKGGLRVGKDFFLCFSPERIDPGNLQYGPGNIPKVVGGICPSCTQLGALVYGQITSRVVPVSTARTAEMSKLIENTFRIVNIGLVNELAVVSGKMGIDIWEAIDAASSKPFGFMPFYPGPGIGGHCIGIDPIYLSWKAKMYGQEIRFIDLASHTNATMPTYVVHRVGQALNQVGRAVKGSKILAIGMAYKRDVNDVRESPSIQIVEELERLGAKIDYYDPYVPRVEVDGQVRRSIQLGQNVWSRYDLVLILTDHSNIDYKAMVRRAHLIFDTRNVLKRNRLTGKHIVRL